MANMLSPHRRIVVIVNPAAGAGRSLTRFASQRAVLDAWPGGLRVEKTVAAGDAERLAAAAAAAGEQAVVAVGGDGTVHEVVNGLLSVTGRPLPALGVFPVGTGCDFARSMGRRGHAPRLSGATTAVDVGHVRLHGGAACERYFVNAANIGAGTAAARRVGRSAILRRTGAVAYILAGLPEVIRRPTSVITWKANAGEARGGHLVNLSVCNGPRFGGGLCLAPEATLTDGALHVASLARPSFMGLLRTLQVGFAADTRARPGVTVERLSTVRVEGEGVVELDGEVPGHLPADFRVLPGGLQVLV
jgi:YegS/Rv2252/BmrU family lipid kinase